MKNLKKSVNCYESTNLEDCGHSDFSLNSKDSYDVYASSTKGVQLSYEGVCLEGDNLVSCFYAGGYNNIYYSDFVVFCENVFGCAGLKRKSNCIFNKQYTKDDYDLLISRIINHMKETGEWGEFFPISSSPFGYNETVAAEFFPMSREEVLKKGYNWKDSEEKNFQVQKSEIPEIISNVNDDICDEILACEITGKNYKIIPQELKFYREMNLPIPQKCPDQRHKERMNLRNPRKLFDRQCMKCEKDIQTTYDPSRPEIVYCETCYLKEVY